ncbi:MAG TPA: LytTR family DNA-binding domain-containing protein [Flavitalea sp.]|nr:LytTR family DNA-binding domain-containing protein [Flavitalea sp.]
MKVIIIEDEIPAAKKLKKMLQGFSPDIEVVKQLTSIHDSLAWFKENELPDLIFMDIELSDGLSFQLIQKANISCPIIFITAFDEYWQEAFEHNSIDYLLKPLKRERLQASLNKFNEIQHYFTARYQNLLAYQNNESKFKDRFLVKRGREFASIKAEDIAFLYAIHKVVCLVETNGSKYILDTSLAEIAKDVDPKMFFRINRKYLVHINSIKKITSLPKSKLLIEVIPLSPDLLIISSENSSEFKKWMSK